MFRDGLNGFASLRTRPNVPVDPALLPPKRYCTECGALLRRSNPGPLCGVCTPHVDIPEWAITVVEFDNRSSTINTLAAALAGNHRATETKKRNAAIRAAHDAGVSKVELARRYNLTWHTVDKILAKEQEHH